MLGSVVMMEGLEDRRMLSAAPPTAGFGTGTGLSLAQRNAAAKAEAYHEAVMHSIAVGKAAGITPDITGSWKGRVKVTIVFVSKSFDLSVDIGDVTAKTATATVVVEGHTFSGTFKGQTKSTEEFSYTYTKGKSSITFAGLLMGSIRPRPGR